MRRHDHRPHPRTRGFTLLEVLIALVILAIGLLGLAALQARGLKFNTDAYVRSQATMLAYEIMEEMRAAGSATGSKFVSSYSGTTPVVFSGLDCDSAAERQVIGITSASVNQRLACWYTDLAETIPAGSGSIAATGTANQYTVTLNWYDRESESTKSQTWTLQVF